MKVSDQFSRHSSRMEILLFDAGLTMPLSIVAICYQNCRVATNISHWLEYSLGGPKLHICKKVFSDQILDFRILHLLFLHFLLLCHILHFGCCFFNTIWVSNSWDPGQAQHIVWPDLDPNCLQP